MINKAFETDKEAYSAFEGRTNIGNESLADTLNNLGVKRLWVGGLALDYCVKASVLDATKTGFDIQDKHYKR